MKRIIVLLIVLLLFGGCSFQIGENVVIATYYNAPEQAYKQQPYSIPIEQIQLDIVEKEIVCASVLDSKALWVALMNEKYLLESIMQVNEEGQYYSLGFYTATLLDDIEENKTELPVQNFSFKSGLNICSRVYTEEQYKEVKDKIDEEYKTIYFSAEIEGKECSFVYVYKTVDGFASTD